MPVVEANGIGLHYEATGDGTALLLVAGLGYGGWVWQRQVPALSERFTAITFDNRGAGQSDKPAAPYDIPTMAADALGLLDALELETAHVCGASLGGMVALQLALDHPERVDRLVLCATTHGGPHVVFPEPEVIQFMAARTGTPEERYQRGMALAFGPDFCQNRAEEAAFIREEMGKNPQPDDAYQRQAYAPLGFDVEARLGELHHPTLVLSGDADRAVPVENARRLAERIPNAELHLFEGAGHLCFIEQPEAFNQTVIGFLKETA